MKVRKTLKFNEEIISAFVAFPAKLMVKYPENERDAKYKLHEDFSTADITPENFLRYLRDDEDTG